MSGEEDIRDRGGDLKDARITINKSQHHVKARDINATVHYTATSTGMPLVNNSHLCKILEMLEEHERTLDGGKLNTNHAGQI